MIRGAQSFLASTNATETEKYAKFGDLRVGCRGRAAIGYGVMQSMPTTKSNRGAKVQRCARQGRRQLLASLPAWTPSAPQQLRQLCESITDQKIERCRCRW